MAASFAAMWCAAAHATVLVVGLPSGRSVAHTSTDSGWERATWADLPDVGSNAFPALADLDGDGDPDALVGHSGGGVMAFENVGSATGPTWSRREDWDPPIDVGSRAAPALGDVDRDGDVDLLVGSSGGNVAVFKNKGTSHAPEWERVEGLDVAAGDAESRPALGDVDGNGKLDLAIGTKSGAVIVFLGVGNGTFVRAADWDPVIDGDRTAPALFDFDGDGRADIVIEHGDAEAVAMRNTGSGWMKAPAAWVPPDPGSGPAGAALAGGTLLPPVDAHIVAKLSASILDGRAPLRVSFDASGSRAASGAALSFTWDFGDGDSGNGDGGGDGDGGGGDGGGDGGDGDGGGDGGDGGDGDTGGGGGTSVEAASALLAAAGAAYADAKSTRDDMHFPEAVAKYVGLGQTLLPLTAITVNGTVSKRGTTQIDRVARWYLQKIAHDLGGIYLYRDLGYDTCGRFSLSYLWSLESKAQAETGGFPELAKLNGTLGNIKKAQGKLKKEKCTVPDPAPMFGATIAALGAGGSAVEHVYTKPGTFTARVVVSDGTESAEASMNITVESDDLPDAPGGPSDNDSDPSQGFGADTPGGTGGTVIRVTEPTESAVRTAFEKANGGHAVIRFEVTEPIAIGAPLPRLTGAFVTVDGNGATLYGDRFPAKAGLVDVRGHDVIVKNIRLRNGGDNLRAQGDGARNIVFRHVSSTGATDDGVSVGYGAQNVTIQHAFLAGNTRSIFMKYGATTNVSIHHSWIQKQWVRGPLVSQSVRADIRNLIVEDWTLWGSRFEKDASGNMVGSLFVLSPYAKSAGGKTNSALRLSQSGPVYTAGNRYDGIADAGDDGTSPTPVDAPPVTTLPVGEMADVVRRRAGCLPRDPVDEGYIERHDGWDVTESTAFRLGPGS